MKYEYYFIFASLSFASKTAILAKAFQEDCQILSIDVEGMVGNLVDELNAIIQRYEEMIEECRSKINSLLDELNSISEETFE